MAYDIPGDILGTLKAGANYSSASNQFIVVKTTSATNFTKQTSVGGVVLGVLQDLPNSSEAGAIMVNGVTRVRVNTTSHSAIAQFDKLCASSGGGVKGSTAVGRYVIGRALGAVAANTTAIIPMLIEREGAGSTSAASGA